MTPLALMIELGLQFSGLDGWISAEEPDS